MKLYFRRYNQELVFMGEPSTEKEAWNMIHNFLEEKKFPVYYIRQHTTPEGTLIYDVGSHTEFFELEGYGQFLAQEEERKDSND